MKAKLVLLEKFPLRWSEQVLTVFDAAASLVFSFKLLKVRGKTSWMIIYII